jgi:hypothetical protein
MTAEEIFGQIAQRQIQGFMFHEQMADYFDFLGLKGYCRCHEYHYYEESASYRRISRYFIEHYNKLVMEMPVSNPHAIPEGWKNHTRQDVDTSTRRNAVRDGFEKWISWEKETKRFYEDMYLELISISEVAGACQVKNLVKDVDRELEKAEKKHLERKADDYDMSNIIAEQQSLHDKYKKIHI